MIICSCNVFSDHEVRSAVVVGAPPLTTGGLFRRLGGRARCGRCAWSIKAIMREHAVAEYEPHISAPKSDAKLPRREVAPRSECSGIGNARELWPRPDRPRGSRPAEFESCGSAAACLQNEAQALRKQSRPSQGQIKLRIKSFRRNSSIGPPLDRDSRGRNRLEMTCPKSKP
jgi:bacterioferritin-associated ferredoxin